MDDLFDDMFEGFVAGNDLEDRLDDLDWVPTDADLRLFRSFGAPRALIREAERRIEEAEGAAADAGEDGGE